MFKKIKQLFCNHTYILDVWQDHISVGDKYNNIVSAKIVLSCSRCNKEVIIYDKWSRHINWLRGVGTNN
ncbi:MAG TPA: hypothetical protein VIM70_08230 [Clostridium sp.]|uniref:hypothetical protein n=1 Tax=Clostridium sp. TaxID=1506 RepID=UPI002F94B469